jgi:hypothetical protein
MHNPFTHCHTENIDGKWYVVSEYWRLECVDEKIASRIQEIISGAYRSGKLDTINEMRSVLKLSPLSPWTDNWS